MTTCTANLADEALREAVQSAEAARTEAERASQAKDHFLALLSHELRTPLTPVVAAVGLLQQQSYLNAESREYLEIIRRNIDVELRLIDDLLDITRINRGKLEVNKRPAEVGEIVNRAVEVCRPDIEARHLRLDVDIRQSPHVVHADTVRLQQMFWNLIKNAIKFTPVGGKIRVCGYRDDGHVVVEVSDNGIGIERDAIERIFNDFEQTDRTITRRFGGLGLGLAISKAMAEVHGGTIEALSDGKDHGATFRVRLPIAAPF